MGCECSSSKSTGTREKKKEPISIVLKPPVKIAVDSKEVKEQWLNDQTKLIEFFKSFGSSCNLSGFSLIKKTKFKIIKDYFNKFEVIKERKFSLVKKSLINLNEETIREIKEKINVFFQKNPELQRYNDFKLLDSNLILMCEKSDLLLKLQRIFSPTQTISLQTLKEEYISVSNKNKAIFIFYSKIENLTIYETEKIKEMYNMSQNNKNLIDFFLVYVHDIANDQLLRSVLDNLEEKGLNRIHNTFLMDPEECRKYIRRNTLESDGCYVFDKGVLKFAGDLMDFYLDDVKLYIEKDQIQYDRNEYSSKKLYLCDYFLNKFPASNLNKCPFSFDVNITKYVSIDFHMDDSPENNLKLEKKFLFFEPIHVIIEYYSKVYPSIEFNLEGFKSNSKLINFVEIVDYYSEILSLLTNNYFSVQKEITYNNNEINSFVLSKLNTSQGENISIEIENEDKFEKYFDFNYNPRKSVHVYHHVNQDNKYVLNNTSVNIFKSITSYNKYNITDMVFLPELDVDLNKEVSVEFFYKGKFEEKSINVEFHQDKANIVLILNDIQGKTEKELDSILSLLNGFKESKDTMQDFYFFPMFIGYGNIDYDFSKFKELKFEEILHLSNNKQNLINLKFWFHSKSFFFKYSFILIDINKKVRYVGNLSEINLASTLKEINSKAGKLVFKENKVLNNNKHIKTIKENLTSIFKEINVRYHPYINFHYKKLYDYTSKKLVRHYYKDIKLHLIIKDKTRSLKNSLLNKFLESIQNVIEPNVIEIQTISIEIKAEKSVFYCFYCAKEVGRVSKLNAVKEPDTIFYYNQYERSFICLQCEENYNSKKDNKVKLPDLVYIKYSEFDGNIFNEIISDFYSINKLNNISDLNCFICGNNLLQQDVIYLPLNEFHYEWEYTWDGQQSSLKYSPIYLCNDNCFNIISGKVFRNFNEKQAKNLKFLNISHKSMIMKKFTISKVYNDNLGSSYSNSVSGNSEEVNNEGVSNKS